MSKPFEPIVVACDIAKAMQDPDGTRGRRQQKGQAALARLLGVTVTTVNQWYWQSKAVSPTSCVKIEEITCGAVTRRMLRPDDWHRWWPELVEKR